MIGKRLFVFLAVLAFLGLQFADCMSAMTPDQQSMKCCGSMPCTPANQNHDCCKNMISERAPNVLPSAPVSLHAPTVAIVEYPGTFEIAPSVSIPPVKVAAQQHSPPDLYTLHASLLI